MYEYRLVAVLTPSAAYTKTISANFNIKRNIIGKWTLLVCYQHAVAHIYILRHTCTLNCVIYENQVDTNN